MSNDQQRAAKVAEEKASEIAGRVRSIASAGMIWTQELEHTLTTALLQFADEARRFGQPQLSGVGACVTQNCGTPLESEPHLGGKGENPSKTPDPGASSPEPNGPDGEIPVGQRCTRHEFAQDGGPCVYCRRTLVELMRATGGDKLAVWLCSVCEKHIEQSKKPLACPHCGWLGENGFLLVAERGDDGWVDPPCPRCAQLERDSDALRARIAELERDRDTWKREFDIQVGVYRATENELQATRDKNKRSQECCDEAARHGKEGV